MSRFEDVVREPAGPGPDGPEFVMVRTGRMRRPGSVDEWTAQQLGLLAQFSWLPAGRVVVSLLESGEGFDVAAAGKPLDDWQRKGVRDELAGLLASARRSYPAAAVLVTRMLAEWTRRWGDGERVLPPRGSVARPSGGPRPVPVAETGIDPERVAAAWATFQPFRAPQDSAHVF